MAQSVWVYMYIYIYIYIYVYRRIIKTKVIVSLLVG